METRAGTLLGGRVRYAQPLQGYRTGIEPVLLAASIPAQRGERVLEAGTGAGAGLLCLGWRIPGLSGLGIERDPGMAALARSNLSENGSGFSIIEADVVALRGMGPVDHAFANPPWHDPGSTRSPDPVRDLAIHQGVAGLAGWIEALGTALAPRGTLTLVLPASLAGEAIAILHGRGLGRLILFPLWPRTGVAAKIVLVQATAGRGAARIAAGLVLHESSQGYTAETEAVLREGAALKLQ